MTLVLDAGALIALERGERRVLLLLDRARQAGMDIVVPAPVWAKVWRADARQVPLARLRRALEAPLVPFTAEHADEVGRLLAEHGTSDVVDAHVVVVARTHESSRVVTSDPEDLRQLDPDLQLVSL